MKPPGWPTEVCDPDDVEFPTSAERWLWDVSSLARDPASVWARRPQALAFRVACDLQARIEGARVAYARARTALGSTDSDITRILSALEEEAATLQRWQREVEVVLRALSGERWRQRL